MNKIMISLRASRNSVLSWLAMILTISGMVFSAACAQTSMTGSPSQSSARQGFSTTAPDLPLATKDPDGTSQPLRTPVGQSGEAATRPVPGLPGAINPVEPTEGAAVTGEVPDSLLTQIIQDLSARLKIRIEKIEIVRAEAVVWNDGSLGCPQPGEFYTQALVPGYWLILEVETTVYDYRASDRGYFFLCKRPSLPALATPQPGIHSPGKEPTQP